MYIKYNRQYHKLHAESAKTFTHSPATFKIMSLGVLTFNLVTLKTTSVSAA